MIGDGFTDMETRGYADVVIGFGANVEREIVKKECDWWVTSTQELIDELK